MATGGEVTGSREQRSDVVHDYTCSTCSKSDQTTEASHYCPECDVCYCKLCMCDHTVLGRSDIDQWGKAAGTTVKAADQSEDVKLKCLRHPQYDIELYCVDHDVVCCRLCPATDHRSCLNMEKIIVTAEEYTLNDDIQNISGSIETLKCKGDCLGEESQIRKRFTESSHTKFISQLLELQTHVNAKFEQIKEESYRRKQHYIDKFNMDQFQCTHIKDKVPKLKSALKPLTDKATHFIKVKRTQEFVDETNEQISGIIDTKIRGVFEELPLEGERKILEVLTTEAHVKMSGLKFRVRIKEDTEECEIVGICQIGNGNLVLADKANTRIKHLNREYTVINHYELQDTPNDVCAVDDTEVAVAMQNNHFLIVNIGTEFKIVRSLEMEHECLQVVYHDDKIYIADSSPIMFDEFKTKIYISDKSGHAIADFETSKEYEDELNKSVAISPDGQRIYVAHEGGTIIAFDPEGNEVAESSPFNDVVGICSDDSGNLLASFSESREVRMLSPMGTEGFEESKTVLSFVDLDPEPSDHEPIPKAVCYDKMLGRVVVGTEIGDYIYVDEKQHVR